MENSKVLKFRMTYLHDWCWEFKIIDFPLETFAFLKLRNQKHWNYTWNIWIPEVDNSNALKYHRKYVLFLSWKIKKTRIRNIWISDVENSTVLKFHKAFSLSSMCLCICLCCSCICIFVFRITCCVLLLLFCCCDSICVLVVVLCVLLVLYVFGRHSNLWYICFTVVQS